MCSSDLDSNGRDHVEYIDTTDGKIKIVEADTFFKIYEDCGNQALILVGCRSRAAVTRLKGVWKQLIVR